MKKVLSLVLAFAMILGSFGFVFASDFPDVKDSEYYGEPVNVLSGLGVIGGFPDGTFKPEKVVTRAEMATMVVNALGMTVTGQADTKFSDVSKAHWASGFINYAASVGFIAGFPDGTFKPDQEVTYDQALTMIVAAEGYKSESLTGNWPGNFVNQARALGILDICKTTGSAKAPRQDIACFLYDALTNKLGYTDKDGAFHPNLDKDGHETDTMLTRLGAKEYDTPFVVTENTAEESLIDLDNYFGAYVTVYRTNDKDAKIVAIASVLSEFIEGDADDLVDDYKAYKTADKKDYVSFNNGESKDPGDDYVPMTGNLKLAVKLSGKTIKEVYSVQVWTNGETFMAEDDIQDEIGGKTPKIGGAKFALDEDDEIDTGKFILNGVDALGDIKEDDVVTVYKKADGSVARVDVSDKTVVGVITKVDAKGETYTIGGETYGLNGNPKTAAADLKKLMTSETEATFYLDYAGDIYYADAEATTTDYAVVLDLGSAGGNWASDKGTKMVKLFLADGNAKEFDAAGDFADSIKSDKTSDMCEIGQLVKYTMNKKDQITKVEPVATKTTIEFDKNGVGAGKTLKDSTIIFNYAGEDKVEEKAKADNYSVLKAADFFEKKVENVYGKDDSGSWAALLAINFQAADKVYTFFVKDGGSNASGRLFTALYDGEVKEFTVTSDKEITLFTTDNAVCYTLTFDGDEVSDITTGTAITLVKQLDGKMKGTFSGNVYTYDETNYSMDADAVVYVKDGSSWSVEKASYLAKSAEYFSDILLFKTDKLVDIVIVVVK